MKKTVSVIVIALFLIGQPSWLMAQKTRLAAMNYVMQLDELAGERKRLSLQVLNAEVAIIGSDKNEISIIAIKGWTEKKDIKYYSQDVKDIQKIDLKFIKERQGVQFKQLSEDFMVYWIMIPKDMSVDYRDGSVFPNRVTVANLDNEAAINTMLSTIHIQNINGRILANSQAGDIEIEYGQKIHPSSIASAGRTVTVKMLENAKAKVRLKVMTGAVNSDFELEGEVSQADLEGTRNVRTIEGTINGGGKNLYVMAHTIHLKKVKCKGKLGNIRKLFKKKKKTNKAIELYTYPCD